MIVLSAAVLSAAGVSQFETKVAEARRLSDEGHVARSLLILNDVIDDVKALRLPSRSDTVQLLEAYHIAGLNYRTLGNDTQSLTYYREAVTLAKAIYDKRRLGVLYNCIFAIYYTRGEYDRAKDLLDMSLSISIELRDSGSVCRIYNNIGLVYYERGDYKTALDYTDKALLYTRPGEEKERSSIYTNRGEIYYSMGDLLSAENEGRRAVEAQGGGAPLEIQPYLNYALVKARLHKDSDARRLLRFIYGKMASLSLPAQSNSYQQLAEINFLMGDSIAGARDLLKYQQLADTLKRMDNDSQIQELLVAYDTERLRQSNDNLQRSVRARNTTLYVVLAFLVLVAVLVAFLVRRLRIDKRNNLLINSQREQILRYEREENERRRRELSDEVDRKTRQLTSYTIDLAAVNEFLAKIHDRLSAVSEVIQERGDGDDANTSATLRDVMYSLKHYNDKPVSEDFRVYFDEVHPDFLRKLSDVCPSLSKNDLRLCAYLHLGMSTKEIAALTYREIRSVESSRNRLRKKLGLHPSESLQEFLKTFAQ